jgi:hypothetical protein
MPNPSTTTQPSGAQPQESQTRTRRFLLPREITIDPDFQFRQLGIDKGHVRGLAQTLRSAGNLDPILVWQEVDTSGQLTGRIVLLDGHQRLAAYATAKGHRGAIPAVVLKGDRAEAMFAAVGANSRESLPLTKSERMDAAWRLVRLPSKRVTVMSVAKAAGVAPRTVDNMRKRWKALEAAGKEITGYWWRDRQDELPEMKDRPEMTDAERTAAVELLAGTLIKALDRMPWKDERIAAEALQRAVGIPKLRSMTEYLFGEADEFAEEQTGLFADTFRHPEDATEGQDF